MTKTGRHQRKLRNMKLTEKYRFQYLGHWILISLLFLVLLDIAVYLLYQQMWQNFVPQGAELAMEESFRHAQAIFTVTIMSLLFAGAVLGLAAFTAHRIGGPFIAMRRTMARVRDGDLNGRLKFRKYDKLEEVEASFNEMMDALQERVEAAESTARTPDFVDEMLVTVKS